MDNTGNAYALTRLQPLKNTDTGNLIEEHIRFWQKYKDEQEAQEQLMKLKQMDYQRKLRADRKKELPEIVDATNVLKYYEHQYYNNVYTPYQNEVYELRKRYLDGDESALFRINEINNQMRLLNNINDNISKATDYYQKNYKKANPVFDDDKVAILDALSTGGFKVMPDRFELLTKNNKKWLTSYNTLAQYLNDYTFHGRPDTTDYTKKANELKSTIEINAFDGNKIPTKDDYLRVDKSVADMFNSDEVLAKTYAYDLKKEIKDFGEVSKDKPLTATQKALMRQHFIETYMDLPKVTNWLKNQKTKLDIDNAKDSKHGKVKQIRITKDSVGDMYKTFGINAEKIPASTEDAYVFHIQGKEGDETPWIQDPKDKTGRIIGITVEQPSDNKKDRGKVYAFGFRDKKIKDENGTEKVVREPYRIDDTTTINQIATQLSKDGTVNNILGDYTGLQNYTNTLLQDEYYQKYEDKNKNTKKQTAEKYW